MGMGAMTGNRCAGLGKENAHARPPLDALGGALKEKVRPPSSPRTGRLGKDRGLLRWRACAAPCTGRLRQSQGLLRR